MTPALAVLPSVWSGFHPGTTIRLALHREGLEVWVSPEDSVALLAGPIVIAEDAAWRDVWAALEARA